MLSGIALMSIGYMMLGMIAVGIMRLTVTTNSFATRWIILIGLIIILPLLLPVRSWAIHTGRRMLALRADDLLSNTEVKPVVYLRSFRADGHQKQLSGRDYLHGILSLVFSHDDLQEPRSEENLIIVANGVGPFVALGRPGERLPQIGAARLYVPNDKWKLVVRQLCQRARLVIVEIGDVTSGLRWELENLSKFVSPERLLIYRPVTVFQDESKLAASYRDFTESFSPFFPKSLPAEIGDSRCIVFGADWGPSLVGAWSRTIRSDLAMLNDEHGLLLKPADVGINKDCLSALSAIETIVPEYKMPREHELPLDLRVQRVFDITFGPLCHLAIMLMLLLLIWPHAFSRFADWLKSWS